MSLQTQHETATDAQQSQFTVPKKKSKWPKRLIILGIAAAVVLFLFAGRGNGGQGAAAGAYLTDTAAVRDMTVTVTGPGTVQPNDTARITPGVLGEILDAPFDEGDLVQKDDLLYAIDTGDMDTAIRQAQTSVEQAQLTRRSAQLSYDNLLKTQRDNEKNLAVKAPGTGVINKLYVSQGDTLSPGTPIAEILDREHMELTLPFHAVDAASFSIGQSALVTVSGTAETLWGTVTELAVTDTAGPGGALTRNVTITVDNPGALSPSSTGSAMIGQAASVSTGSFRYAESCQITALYSGELETLSIREGDWVTEDQEVGRFKATDIQSQLDSAAISLENAALTLRTAEDNLQRTLDNLEDYTITAPISGRIIEKKLEAGDTLDQAALSTGPIMVIYDMSRFTFELSIDELDISRIAPGQSVSVTVSALNDKAFSGKVDRVSINGSTLSGKTTYPVTVVLDGDGESLAAQGLYPGMNVSASIIVEEMGAVLSIPEDYVSRGDTVLVAGEGCLDENGNVADTSKIETRTVTLGRSNEDYVEILSGLEEGEIILRQNTTSSIMDMMRDMRG